MVLDKYPVGSGIYGSRDMAMKRLNAIMCIGIKRSALNTIGPVNLNPLPLSLMKRKHNSTFITDTLQGRLQLGLASEGSLDGTQKSFLMVSLSVRLLYDLAPKIQQAPTSHNSFLVYELNGTPQLPEGVWAGITIPILHMGKLKFETQ